MKFLGVVIVYLAIALLLGLGIYLAVFGKFWLLILGFVIYLLAFSKFGCTSH